MDMCDIEFVGNLHRLPIHHSAADHKSFLFALDGMDHFLQGIHRLCPLKGLAFYVRQDDITAVGQGVLGE